MIKNYLGNLSFLCEPAIPRCLLPIFFSNSIEINLCFDRSGIPRKGANTTVCYDGSGIPRKGAMTTLYALSINKLHNLVRMSGYHETRDGHAQQNTKTFCKPIAWVTDPR